MKKYSTPLSFVALASVLLLTVLVAKGISQFFDSNSSQVAGVGQTQSVGVGQAQSATIGKAMVAIGQSDSGAEDSFYASASGLSAKGISQSMTVEQAFGGQDSVPVIIQFKLPYDKFYEKGQSANRGQEKKAQFEKAKNAIAAHFKSKSKKAKMKRDLKIVNAVSADVDQATYVALKADPDVMSISYDLQVKAVLDTSATQIGAPTVWSMVDNQGVPLTGYGKIIAIIDTGVDYHHPDLGGCLGPTCKVIGGYNFVNSTPDPMDDHGHGTHVAATAAGKGLLNGIAPDAKILAYKVLNSMGSGVSSAIIAAIERAVDPNQDGNASDHADVLSMSLGAQCGTYSDWCGPTDTMSAAINNATAAGVVATIAAGNAGSNQGTVATPGTALSAITVAAACKPSQLGTMSYCSTPMASFSSRGPVIYNGIDYNKPDITAPGVLICAARWSNAFASAPTCFDQNHVRISGTSMATPHMAGVAALVLEANPTYTPDQVKSLLKLTATPLGSGMTYNDQGAGLVNLPSAIPFVDKGATVSPRIWSVSSSPTTKLSLTDKSFTVTATKSGLGTLTLVSDISAPGASVTFSKSTIDLSSGSDTFTATVHVDNDLAIHGSYLGRIKLVGGSSQIIASVGIILNEQSTLVVSPGLIDYGIDGPNLASWTSAVKTVQIQNLRTDVPQTVQISKIGVPAGATLNVPTSVVVPPGAQVTVNSNMVINNASIVNGIYNASIQFGNAADKQLVGIKFTKSYIINVTAADMDQLAFVYIRDAAGHAYFNDYTVASGNTITTLVGYDAPYDVQVRYGDNFDSASDITVRYMVIKEGVTLTNGIANVTVNKSDAVNTINFAPKDINGNRLNNTGGYFSYTYLPHPAVDHGLYIGEAWVGDATEYHFSNISSNYRVDFDFRNPWSDPVQDRYMFKRSLVGISSSMTLSQDPITTFSNIIDSDKASGSIRPLTWTGGGNSSCPVCTITVNFPFTQHFYLSPASAQTFASESDDSRIGCPSSGACSSIFASPHFDTSGNRYFGMNNFPQRVLPKGETDTMFTGIGPTVWVVKTDNTTSKIHLYSSIGYVYGSIIFQPALVRQGFALQEYNAIPYTLTKSGGSTVIGSYPASGIKLSPNSKIPDAAPISATAGAYTLESSFTYPVLSRTMTGKVTLAFDTSKADPNPPAITKLYYYTNGTRNEFYNPSAQNTVSIDFDPVGGTLSNVTVSLSGDNTTFVAASGSLSQNTYFATLPQVPGLANVWIKVDAVDLSNNRLTYTFELPVDTAQFIGENYPLSVSFSGAGSGKVTSDPAGINCSTGTCTAVYFTGTSVTLSASTTGNMQFMGWSGACSGTSACNVVMNATTTVGAEFATKVPSPVISSFTVSPNPLARLQTATFSWAASDVQSCTIDYLSNTELNRIFGSLMGVVKGPVDSVSTTTPATVGLLDHGTSGTVEVGCYTGPGLTGTYIAATTSLVIPPASSSDTTPPTASLTAPADATTVSGTSVTISADASDNVGVTGVTFRVDGAIVGSEDTTSPYSVSWNTTSATNATHTITATARDAAGNRTTSTRSVAVSNTPIDNPPTVPANLTATAVSTSEIDLSWSPSVDSDATPLAGYKIYRNGTFVANMTSGTTFKNNSGLTPGTTYSYYVVAYDTVGNLSGKSNTVSATTLVVPPISTLSVTIVTPQNGTVLPTKGQSGIQVTASDSTYSVTLIKIFTDISLVASCSNTTSCDAKWNMNKLSPGQHIIRVEAYDSSNAVVTKSVNVTR